MLTIKKEQEGLRISRMGVKLFCQNQINNKKTESLQVALLGLALQIKNQVSDMLYWRWIGITNGEALWKFNKNGNGV